MCTHAGPPPHSAATDPTTSREPRDRRAVMSRRAALGGTAALATAALPGSVASASPAAPRAWGRRGLQDLTHPLGPRFPAFAPGEEARRRTTVTIEDDGYYIQEWTVIEHIGTHVDAPGHFVAGGRLAPDLDVAELVTPLAVVDVADRARRDPDTVVTVDDLRRYERRHGRIPRQATVAMHSGWARKVDDPDAYRGTDADGVLHFPGFGPEACEWLVRRRRVRALAVDTLSTDPGVSTTFDVHLTLGGADRYGVENLADLDRVPPSGATLIVGLVPFVRGSGGQARVLASW